LRAELGELEDNFLRAAAAHGARRRNRPPSAAQQAKATNATNADPANNHRNNGYSNAGGHFAPNSGVWRALRTPSSGATSADSGCRDSDDDGDDDEVNDDERRADSPNGAKRASRASQQQQRLSLAVECDYSIGGAGDCGRGGAFRGTSDETGGAPPSLLPHQLHPNAPHNGAMSDAEWLGEATLGDVSDDMDDLLENHGSSRSLGRSSFMAHTTAVVSSSLTLKKNSPSSYGYSGTPTSVAPVPFSSLKIQEAPLLVAPPPSPPVLLASASSPAPPSISSSEQGEVVAPSSSLAQALSSREPSDGALDESLGSFFAAGGELSTDLGDFLPDECFSFI